MGVKVITPASDKSFTTLNRVKVNLGLGTSTGEDEILSNLIEEVGQLIVDETGREFAEETVKETLKGSDRVNLLLTRTPIVEVESILENSVTLVTDYSIDDADAGVLSRRGGWIANVGTGWGITRNYEHAYERSMYEITYKAGYVMANSTSTAEHYFPLPSSLKNIATSAVCMAFKTAGRDPSILSKKVGDVSVTFGHGAGDRLALSSYLRANLSRWTRIA